MNIKLIKGELLYGYYLDGEEIELYRKDVENMKVGDIFEAQDLDLDTDTTEQNYVTVTCVYKDKNGALLREYTQTIYTDDSYEPKEDVELIWIELKCGGR